LVVEPCHGGRLVEQGATPQQPTEDSSNWASREDELGEKNKKGQIDFVSFGQKKIIQWECCQQASNRVPH